MLCEYLERTLSLRGGSRQAEALQRRSILWCAGLLPQSKGDKRGHVSESHLMTCERSVHSLQTPCGDAPAPMPPATLASAGRWLSTRSSCSSCLSCCSPVINPMHHTGQGWRCDMMQGFDAHVEARPQPQRACAPREGHRAWIAAVLRTGPHRCCPRLLDPWSACHVEGPERRGPCWRPTSPPAPALHPLAPAHRAFSRAISISRRQWCRVAQKRAPGMVKAQQDGMHEGRNVPGP